MVSIPEVGGGSSCTVSATEDEEKERSMVNLIQDRNFVAKNYLRKGKDARYAIKEMSPDILRDPERFVAGMIDLAIEAVSVPYTVRSSYSSAHPHGMF